jgi:Rrf2 family protein
MLSLTRKADYALVAMAELARRSPQTLSARRLADSVHVPLPVLTNVLNQLLHHGLVVSLRGSQGGYRLSRDPGGISLADIIEAIDGPSRLAQCCGEGDATSPLAPHSDPACNLEHSCRIKAPVQRVHQSLRQFLSGIPLSQIAFDVPVAIAVSTRS